MTSSMRGLATLGLALALLVLGSSVSDAEQWWENPDADTSTRTSDDSRGSWLPTLKMPSLPRLKMPSMPKLPGLPAKRKSGPSLWSRATNGTQQFFSRTTDTVMSPFRRKPEKPTPGYLPTGYGSSSREKEKKPGFFSRLFGGEPEREPPRTVSEFIGQPMPGF